MGGFSRLVAASLLLAVAAGGVSSFALAQQQAKAPEEKPEDYPDGPNRLDTFTYCTGCHGFKVVAAQGQSRERWNDTLDFMVTRHKMIDPPAELRGQILDYLAEAFPERRQPGGWKNPFQ
ncbi:MAG: hypothetical protein EKK41_28525 [Hyphomicrobiales bacterium]|nr:MAG: hypothetical protein EKK41_28525 [Hyphomicrobiales bacterium]